MDQTDPEQQQAPYVIGNARVSFRTANNKLELTAFSNNVGNQNYRLMGYLPSNGYQRITLGFPRTYGASLVLRY